MSTPLRAALAKQSRLRALVKPGLKAMKAQEVTDHLDGAIRAHFRDSVDIDAAFEPGHENEHRWDYLLGHQGTMAIVGLEPHSARTDQVTTVIEKRKAALEQLRGHLKAGARVGEWYWVASGKVDFADTEKAIRRLEQNGIKFIGRKLLEKHLPKK